MSKTLSTTVPKKRSFHKSAGILPIDIKEFAAVHWTFIRLRGDLDMEPSKIAAELGVTRPTIQRWMKHPPFGQEIHAKWGKRAEGNVRLTEIILNRVLVELEVRTRPEKMKVSGEGKEKKGLSDTQLLNIHRTLRESHGVNVNIGVGVSVTNRIEGATPGELLELHLSESEETDHLKDLMSTSSATGQRITFVADKSAVPASTPDGL